METLIIELLDDPFGVSRNNYKSLLSIYEDELGEEAANELDQRIEEVTINHETRLRLKFTIPY